MDQKTKRAFRESLLDWFAEHRRDLPWRHNRTPYRVWISELMLQQTRVDQALDYYLRFVKRFPTLTSLAEANRNDVLKLWEGLGYYSRAIRAHETAAYLVRKQGGKFPRTYEGLLALPGIGPYTAAAIASLALGLDHAVLDGNVIRVMTRVFAIDAISDAPSVRQALQSHLDALLPKGKAAEFNEAMMELGALVCTPAKPSCLLCPLSSVCQGRKGGNPEHYPVRRAKKKVPHRHVGAGVIINDRRQVLLAQRKETSMLGGLWEFPGGGVETGETLPQCIKRELKEELDIVTRAGPHLITVRHTFSHFRMDLHAYWMRVESGRPKAIGCANWKWVPVAKITEYALPVADQKILVELLKQKKWPAF